MFCWPFTVSMKAKVRLRSDFSDEYYRGGKRGIPLYWIGSRNHVRPCIVLYPSLAPHPWYILLVVGKKRRCGWALRVPREKALFPFRSDKGKTLPILNEIVYCVKSLLKDTGWRKSLLWITKIDKRLFDEQRRGQNWKKCPLLCKEKQNNIGHAIFLLIPLQNTVYVHSKYQNRRNAIIMMYL